MARYGTVCSITLASSADRQANLSKAIRLIDEAASDHPDLIVLPEFFCEAPGDPDVKRRAEPIDGSIISAAAAKAAEHHAYVVCPFVECTASGHCHNTAVLLGRDGRVVGAYRKYQPTIGEMEHGIEPGEELPVFDLDFGKLGIAICFDLNFWEVGAGLKAAGAEIIAFPSMYRGGQQLINWAYQLRCFMVSATPTEHSRIVDPLGRVLGDSSNYQPIISRRINLDYAVVHIDYNETPVKQAKQQLGPRLEVAVASPEGLYMLINHDSDTTIDQTLSQFGIEPLEAYYARARAFRRKELEGRQPR
jgi:predicted amidohydrolase